MPAQMPLEPLNPRQFSKMGRNLENLYQRRTPMQELNGRLWYPHARDLAETIGATARQKTGGLSEAETMPDHVRGAGIISALSPQNPWTNNVRGAQELAATGKANATLGTSVRKANLIREGVHPEDVLNPTRDPKKPHEGPHKTHNFFQNIEDPDKIGPVTVDSHAARAAIGWSSGHGAPELASNELRDDRRYNQYADLYRHVANRVGEKPHDLQAITWLAQRGIETYEE